MPGKRLRWQLYPSYLLITLVSLLAVTWFASTSFRSFYLEQTRSDLEAMARLVEEQVNEHISNNDSTDLDALCDALGRRSGARVTLILQSGVVVGDSDEDAQQMENHGDRPEIVAALANNVGTSIRFSTTLEKDMMYVALPPPSPDAGIPIVRMALPVTAVKETLRRIYLRIALGGILIAVIAALIGWPVSRRLTRPIEELRQGAERFAAGDLTRRIHVPESAEIGALAVAMNQMASQLDRRINATVEQRNEQDAVLSSMVESVLAVDADECLLRINTAAAELFGIDGDNVKGRRFQETVRNPGLQDLLTRALTGGGPVEGEITLYEPSERSLQVHANVLRDSAGRRIGAVMVLHDITTLRRLEQVRRDFVANVSHELKTPITTIKGFVETLSDGALDNREDAERFLELIAKHTDRLHAIIEDLLFLSRLEQDTDGVEIERRPTAFHDVAKRAVELCQARAETRGVTIELKGDPSIRGLVNAPLIEQALVNLIDNAVKYSDEGSVVTVTTEQTGEAVTIAVGDTGSGIDPQHIPRIFERFYRPDTARSRSFGGTGLGLAIVKHIALAHGGRVAVESQLGQGSTFTLTLPEQTA